PHPPPPPTPTKPGIAIDLPIRDGASYHVLLQAEHQVNPGGAGRKCLENEETPLQLSGLLINTARMKHSHAYGTKAGRRCRLASIPRQADKKPWLSNRNPLC